MRTPGVLVSAFVLMVAPSCGYNGIGIDAGQSSGGGGAGGDAGLKADAGRPGVYSGCSYIGGINRAEIGKLDTQTGQCVAIRLISPGRTPDAGVGLTVTDLWAVESIMLWTSAAGGCGQVMRPPGAILATAATGSVTVEIFPGSIDVDAVLAFPATSASPPVTVEMKAKGVSLASECRP